MVATQAPPNNRMAKQTAKNGNTAAGRKKGAAAKSPAAKSQSNQ